MRLRGWGSAGKAERGDPWEVSRKRLAKALKRSAGAKCGRPPLDTVMMFRIMVLQALYSLSDDQAEFQIQDRLSFMRDDLAVPGATQARAVENLFAHFDKHFTKAGYLAMGGQIVDAKIMAAPKQRDAGAEKADTKAGKVPDEWKDKPAKIRQKDRDARWTVKFWKANADEEGKIEQRDIAVPAFGYKEPCCNRSRTRLHPRLCRLGWKIGQVVLAFVVRAPLANQPGFLARHVLLSLVDDTLRTASANSNAQGSKARRGQSTFGAATPLSSMWKLQGSFRLLSIRYRGWNACVAVHDQQQERSMRHHCRSDSSEAWRRS